MKKQKRLLPVLLAAMMAATSVTPVTAIADTAAYEEPSSEQFGGGRV